MHPEFARELFKMIGEGLLILAIISTIMGFITAKIIKCFKFFPKYEVIDIMLVTSPLCLLLLLYILSNYHPC